VLLHKEFSQLIQHMRLSLFILALLVASAATLASSQAQSPTSTGLNRAPLSPAAARPDDGDSIVIPDGTPIPIEVSSGDPCNKFKVGDVIDFKVAFALRADGLVLIPHGMDLTGKIVAKCPYVPQKSNLRFDAPPAEVVIAFDEFKLPSGEFATLRATREPPAKARESQPGADVRYNGVSTLMFGKPWYKDGLFVGKQATIEVVYLNGPLRVSRAAAVQTQSGLRTAHAYVFASGLPYLACGQKFWSLDDDNGPSLVQVKLNPGTYWISTNVYVGKLRKNPRATKIKVDLLADHEYQLKLDKNHELVVNELDDRTRSGHFFGYDSLYHRYVAADLTNLNAEESRLLAAEPIARPQP
jgi:hypothetical protein